MGSASAAVSPPATFGVEIQLEGAHTESITFGMDPLATSAYDGGLDIALPGMPPSGNDAVFVGVSPFPRLRVDIRPTAELGDIWRLNVTQQNGSPIVLTWGSSFPSYLTDKALRFRKASDDPYTWTNMKSIPSVTIQSAGQYYIVVASGGNHPPTPGADSATVAGHDTAPASIDVPVLANDTDADGHGLSIRSAPARSTAGGTVEIVANGQALRYTPPAGWYGLDTIRYEVTDDHPVVPTTATGTLTVTVSGPDWVPPSGLLNTMTLHAAVRLPSAAFVNAAGSLLAVFRGEEIRGVGALFDGPAAPMQFQVSVGSNSTAETGLTLRLYDAGSGRVHSVVETLDFVADGTEGSIVAPRVFTTPPELAPPTITISGVEDDEGDAGPKPFAFAVRLSRASETEVRVDYTTADGSATVAHGDYEAGAGTLVFAPGETVRTITVQVYGDLILEEDEQFRVTLANPVGATLAMAEAVGTIRNDDVAPLPRLSITGASVAEGDAGARPLAFEVTLDLASETAVRVDYATADGSATVADGDYQAVAGELVFAPGETGKTILVSVWGDTRVEPDEQFLIVLSNPVGATLAVAQATGTIRNDDQVDLPSLSIASAEMAEGDMGLALMTFTVTLSAPSPAEVRVSYETVDADAEAADGDYQSASDDLVFPPGETVKTLGVIVYGDTKFEGDEQFLVNLFNPVNALLTAAQATGTIRNDDLPPGAPDWQPPSGLLNTMTLHGVVRLPDGTYVSAAGSMLAVFKGESIRGVGTIFNGPATPMQFQVSVGSNSATEPDLTLKLYDAASGLVYAVIETFTFVADSTLGSIVVPAEFTTQAQAVGPALRLLGTLGNEGHSGQRPFLFPVVLEPASEVAVTVQYATADGTASVAGNDYLATSGTLTFAPGETFKTITVQVLGDTAVEPDETFILTLSNPTGATLAVAQATGTIRNDDIAALPALSVADASVNEGNAGQTALSFTVSLSAAATGTVTVAYATTDGTASVAGNDYLATSGTLTFAPGETFKTITVQVLGDTAVEPDETFTLTLSNPTGATLAEAQATGTIRNDDSQTGRPDWEPPSGLLNTMTLHGVARFVDGPYVSAQDSMLAVFRGDTLLGVGNLFDGPAAQMQFQVSVGSNQTSETGLNVKVYDAGTNAVYDANETVDFVADSTLGTIVVPREFTVSSDPPATPSLSIGDVEGAEGNSDTTAFVFTVRLNPAASATVTVSYATGDGSATVAGGDYRAASGLLTFSPGETTKTITILVNGDTTVEPDETFTVTLSSPAGATLADAQAVGTIRNDDSASLPSLTVGDAAVYEGGTAAFAVTLSAAASATVTVTYATADGSATLAGNDYTAASGTLTFSPGETQKTVLVSTRTDTLTETTETFFLNLSNPVNAVLADAQGQGTLYDGAAPVLSVNDVSGAEGTVFVFTVTLSRTSPTAVTVRYATADGSATAAGGDYQSTTGTLTFAAGQTTRTVSVTVLADATVEADETFRVLLSDATGAAIADAEGLGTIRGTSVPWYPAFAVEPQGIVSVTIRRTDGTLVLESQAIDFDTDGQHTVEARHYKHGTGSGRAGLLPGQYLVQTAVWNQDAQEFVASGSLLQLPTVAYTPAAAPAPTALTASPIEGSNRNWSLGFAGAVQAQGFEIQVRDTLSGRLAHHLAEEFLPETPEEAFPSGPTRPELTRLHLDAAGAYQWRLRFFTPLDPPSLTTEAWNWSAWKDLITLTETSIDPPRKPALPALADRWYYPEPGAEISADPAADVAFIDLSWSPVANADSYYLHLTTSEGRVVVNRQLVSASHLGNVALSPGTYFWALCPANSALGRDGIASAWMEPFPFFTVLPGVSTDVDVPGEVTVTGATRLPDGYVRLSLSWTGRVAPAVRILVLDPGIMLEAAEDRDASPTSYTTEQFDLYLTPGRRTLVRVQGLSASGEMGPWSPFVPIVVPPQS